MGDMESEKGLAEKCVERFKKNGQISLEDSGGMRVHQQVMAKAQNQMYVL